MAYDHQLADRVRTYLAQFPKLKIEEKKMFGGLAFMIDGKMCINVTDDNLMCRFDPQMTEELSTRPGFGPMIMKGIEYKGYCYVEPEGFRNQTDFEFWINLCLDFNSRAKSSKKK
ncbi:TfoX/Sxy family protein [Belliella marina]|uniref:TfoX/Sxy family protein n=1 Tax=Belliella marina TaxID=1644146 RepID=A0ABW4VJ02_9BACT